jgi:uncharacterized membrane protein YbhN (UPF0104 family)
VAGNQASASAAWVSLRNPDPAWVIALPLAILATCALTSVVLFGLTRRAAPASDLRLGEMTALTMASTLGNLVPMQPGLVGRIAYLHRVHEIPVAIGVLIAVQATLLTLGATGWMAIGLLLARLGGLSWLAAPASALLLLPMWIEPGPRLRPLGQAFLLRLGEVLLAALRCGACFALVGKPIDAASALALACASSAANTVPLLGNGLGVREWVTGLLAPSLAGVATPDALAAELLNRAVEVLLVVPLGLASTLPLARRLGEALRTRRVEPVDGVAATAPGGAIWRFAMRLPQRDFDASDPAPSTPTSSER